MYFEYLINLYWVVWGLGAVFAYKYIKIYTLLFILCFSRSKNKFAFILSSITKIAIILALIGGAMYASYWGSNYIKALKERPHSELSAMSVPNKEYCVGKVSEYFGKNILIRTYYIPEFYKTCLEVTVSYAHIDFCGNIKEKTKYKETCNSKHLTQQQCDGLYLIAQGHCTEKEDI